MPPELPVVSGEELARALQNLGFARLRQSGSHVILRSGSTGRVVPLQDLG
ncbi:MAG: type II toxin-antitoxin system HicA family toxin [Xanthomonadales bacterium]|nr:type II toxin-antitoxin system HicA family toxin [Xanthomonadales bacterium]